MKSIFFDCNDQLAPVWASVIRADDPPIDVNVKPFAREDLPRSSPATTSPSTITLICRPSWWQCPQLKHIVFLGTGPASYMNVG